jgi:hypothetical protein
MKPLQGPDLSVYDSVSANIHCPCCGTELTKTVGDIFRDEGYVCPNPQCQLRVRLENPDLFNAVKAATSSDEKAAEVLARIDSFRGTIPLNIENAFPKDHPNTNTAHFRTIGIDFVLLLYHPTIDQYQYEIKYAAVDKTYFQSPVCSTAKEAADNFFTTHFVQPHSGS